MSFSTRWKRLKDNFFSFSGRTTRKEFWTFYPIYIFFAILSAFLYYLLIMLAPIFIMWIVVGLYIGLSITLAISMYALFTRRLHDVGKSGKWVFVLFILNVLARIDIVAVINVIYLVYILYLCSKKSVPDNKYGKCYEADYFFTQDN